MSDYDSLSPDLLGKAYFSELRPDEICWKPKDIKEGIKELDSQGKEVSAISIYFKVGNEVYCPLWSDCLMLKGDNISYLNLFEGIDLEREVDYEMIYQLIGRFALIVPADYGWSIDKANLKTHVPKELSAFDLDEMYFCLNME